MSDAPPVAARGLVKRDGEIDYPDFVEQRIQHLAAAARAKRGIEERSEEEYELGQLSARHFFWPVVVALAVLAAAFVVALLIL